MGDEDSDDEEDYELGPNDKLTKSGYLQDGFVVDDDEFEDEDEDDEFEDEDEDDEFEDEDEDDEYFEGEPDQEDDLVYSDDNDDNIDSNTENAVSPEKNKKNNVDTVFQTILPDKDSELSE